MNLLAFTSSFPVLTRKNALRVAPLSPTPPTPHRQESRARPALTMLFENWKPFQREAPVSLPQYDPANRAKRAAEVESQRQNYRWIFKGCGDAPLLDGVPEGEGPQLGWVEEIAHIIARVALNAVINSGEEFHEDSERKVLLRVSQVVAPIFFKVATGKFGTVDAMESFQELSDLLKTAINGQGVTLDDYKDQFNFIKLDNVAKLDQFMRDDIFGWYRVAGPNPMKIQKLTGSVEEMFPDLTNEHFQGIRGFSGDTIEAAAAENRLFFVNYKEFDGIPTGNDINGNLKPMFVYAPRALLAVPVNKTNRTTVLPIAIYCGQDKSFPMYTANERHTDPITWIAAKLTVQVSDAVAHEAVYHLGRTHLLVEVFLCSTYRTLPKSHPIHKLLSVHFYGTAFINNAAVERLINPGGTVDDITAPDILITSQMAASATTDPSFSFNDLMPFQEMASRGVFDAPELNYPYRDDVKRLWPVLEKWVRAFLSSYYKNDKDVENDYELAAWCREVHGKDTGNLGGFGEAPDGRIVSLNYLVKAISMIIFTASIQHAALNFPQASMMQFSPAMPLGGYAPAPKTAKPFSSINDWVTKMLPPLEKAQKQLNTAEVIGVLKYTTFGEYGKNLSFSSDDVDAALAEFQEDLGLIGAKIQERNKEERRAGLPAYSYLIPKNIPQSINI